VKSVPDATLIPTEGESPDSFTTTGLSDDSEELIDEIASFSAPESSDGTTIVSVVGSSSSGGVSFPGYRKCYHQPEKQIPGQPCFCTSGSSRSLPGSLLLQMLNQHSRFRSSQLQRRS